MNKSDSILSSIKATLLRELETEDLPLTATRPAGPGLDSAAEIMPIVHSDELRFLNLHWADWSRASDFSSHRKIFGRVISFIKRRLQRYLFGSLLKDYLDQEREFSMNLVRFCNATARYVDNRDQRIFWETIGKLDAEISNLENRYDGLIVSTRDDFSQRVINSFSAGECSRMADHLRDLDLRLQQIEKALSHISPKE